MRSRVPPSTAAVAERSNRIRNGTATRGLRAVHPHDAWHAVRPGVVRAVRSRLKVPAVHVDHCHEAGRVRGVPCFNCKSAIGKLGDDPDTSRRAISYLEGNLWNPTLVAQGVYRQPS
ncbi:endonuclease domain-containing protein [Streptomyces sp. NPDC051577]|uniref:endonuclease domain-containing protein n=1 Tax=Streptomyces sp. NPDC051577 TaxID=3155166 RepID=UPI00343B6AEE